MVPHPNFTEEGMINFREIRERSRAIASQAIEFDSKGPKLHPSQGDELEDRVLASFTLTKNLYVEQGCENWIAEDFAEAAVRERYQL